MSSTIEQWPNLSAWTGSTGSFAVSGGWLYANARGTTPSITRPMALASGRPFRLVTQIKVHAGAAAGWMLVAVQSATQAFGVGVDRGAPRQYFGGVGSAFAAGPATIADGTRVTVCIQADAAGISVSMTDAANNVWAARRPWTDMAGDITSLVIFGNDDTTGSAGAGIGPLGVENTGVTISPRTGIEDTGRATAVMSAEGDTSLILLPPGYDSSRPARAVVHCHGASNNHREIVDDLGPDVPVVTAAQLAAGYIVSAGNFRGDSFGNPASVTSVNGLATYLQTTFAIDALALSSDSMGALVALNTWVSGAHRWKAWIGYESGIDLHTEDGGTWWRTSSTGLAFGAAFRSAYGVAADYSDLREKAGPSNPIIRLAEAYEGLDATLWASYADTTADRTQNTDAFAALVAGVASVTVNNATGNHNDPSHYNGPAVVSALDTAWTATGTTIAYYTGTAWAESALNTYDGSQWEAVEAVLA